MGADQPILLQNRCPAQDDPEILSFLRLAMAASGSDRATLELEPEGIAEARTYRIGPTDMLRTSIPLNADSGFRATLCLGIEGPPGESFVALVGTWLARILECLRLREQTSLLRAALDTTSSSVMLFDDRGDIVYANPRADRLLSLQTEDELLAGFNGDSKMPLMTLLCSMVERVSAADTAGASWKRTLDLADGRVMACEVLAIQPSEVCSSPAVVVLLQPVGGEPEARLEAFFSTFGLSPREREVVSLLVQGLTTAAMADRLGISPHTIRDHLKNLYRKTGTGSRGELLGQLSGVANASPIAEREWNNTV
ncbi:MAG: helix-turn-helix transcriptional regulator [Thermoanaerobaculales bacterium]